MAVLPGFRNLVGHHCSSSAVRSVLAYDGLDVSEALVFGLGSGLGFFYVSDPKGSPTRRFNGRAPDLEGNFYGLAGCPLSWTRSWRPEVLQAALLAGRPVLAQTDIQPIPYYDDAHFSGHGLAVVGLEREDEDAEVVTADIAAEGFSRMPLRCFREAVAHDSWPLLAPYGYAAAPKLHRLDVAAMAPRAVARTAAYMLRPPSPHEGVAGMRKMAAELPSWLALADVTWVCRFAYQAIEKRGTGGGGFRWLYRDFLDEVRGYVPAVSDEIVAGFGVAGERWRELGQLFKTLAFQKDLDFEEDGARLREAAALLESLAALETALFGALEA